MTKEDLQDQKQRLELQMQNLDTMMSAESFQELPFDQQEQAAQEIFEARIGLDAVNRQLEAS